MSNSLLGSLTDLMSPALLRTVAGGLEEPEDAVSKGMSAIFPLLLGSTAQRSDDPGFMSTLFGLVTDAGKEADLMEKPESLLGKAAATLPMMLLGGKLLDALFGNNLGKLAGNVGSHAGVKASSAASMLKFAAPLLLGLLSRSVKKDGLNSSSLGGLLRAEKDTYMEAIPGPLGRLDGYFAAPAGGGQRRDTYVPPPPPPEKKSIWRWLLPLLIALALLWMLRQCMGGKEEATPVSRAPAPAAEKMPVQEPIAAPAAVLYFDLDSTDLPVTASSDLEGVIAYLKEHPNARVAVTGYHDPTGDAAHNEELAKERAAAVQQALMTAGISLNTIEMAKPMVTTGTGTLEEARRVEVTVVP
jgi:Bacterial protein of unknown function (DUF937)/OmpA family